MSVAGEFSGGKTEREYSRSGPFVFLDKVAWTSQVNRRNILARDDIRINELLALPAEDPIQVATKTAAVAYYALELSTGLKPLAAANVSQPLTRGSIGDYQALAVYTELIEAATIYTSLRERDKLGRRISDHNKRLHQIQKNIKIATADIDERNNGPLAALGSLENQIVGRQSISTTLSHDSKYVLCMFMAKERGKVNEYTELESVFLFNESANLSASGNTDGAEHTNQ